MFLDNVLIGNTFIKYLEDQPIQTLENFIQTSEDAYALGKDKYIQRINGQKTFGKIEDLTAFNEDVKLSDDMFRKFTFGPDTFHSENNKLSLLLKTFQLISPTVTSIQISIVTDYKGLFEIYNGISKDTINLRRLELNIKINERRPASNNNSSLWSQINLPNVHRGASGTLKKLSISFSGRGFLTYRGMAKLFIMTIFNWAKPVEFLKLYAPGFSHFILWIHHYLIPRHLTLFPNLKNYVPSLRLVNNGNLENVHKEDLHIFDKMPIKEVQIHQISHSPDLQKFLSRIMDNTIRLSLSIDDIRLCFNMSIPRIFPPSNFQMAFTNLRKLELINWNTKLDWLKDVSTLEKLYLLNPDLPCILTFNSDLISWIKDLHTSMSKLRKVVIITKVPISGSGVRAGEHHIEECNISLNVIFENHAHRYLPGYFLGSNPDYRNW